MSTSRREFLIVSGAAGTVLALTPLARAAEALGAVKQPEPAIDANVMDLQPGTRVRLTKAATEISLKDSVRDGYQPGAEMVVLGPSFLDKFRYSPDQPRSYVIVPADIPVVDALAGRYPEFDGPDIHTFTPGDHYTMAIIGSDEVEVVALPPEPQTAPTPAPI